MERILTPEELEQNAKKFEHFYLLPKDNDRKDVDIRLEVISRWASHQIKSEVLKRLELPQGDTIMAKIKPFCLDELIDDNNITLFASRQAARWIIDNNVVASTVIDCRVRLYYSDLPVLNNDEFRKGPHLIMQEGYAVIPAPKESDSQDEFEDEFKKYEGFKPLKDLLGQIPT